MEADFADQQGLGNFQSPRGQVVPEFGSPAPEPCGPTYPIPLVRGLGLTVDTAMQTSPASELGRPDIDSGREDMGHVVDSVVPAHGQD